MKTLVTIVSLFLASVVHAQTPAAEQARLAAAALEDASAMLADAERARDRIKALTETIQAFENGLGAMREGLRQVAINEAQLSRKLQAQEAEVAELIAIMQAMDGGTSPVIFLHPDGPLGTARAGMLLGEIAPALNKRADTLRADLENVQTLRKLQVEAAERLQSGLNEVQTARTTLNQAMANRTELPMRFTEDPVRTGILIASTETLDGFASGLSQIVAEQFEPAPEGMGVEPGALPLPVRGVVLRRAGEADAAGVTRPGVLFATRPGAIVTSPTSATIRYAGPLLDFGNVVILEPQVRTLFVFAGLEVVYGRAGQVIPEGTPVGLMRGALAKTNGELSPLREGTGTERSETLYIEVRLDNQTQDPGDWFRLGEDG